MTGTSLVNVTIAMPCGRVPVPSGMVVEGLIKVGLYPDCNWETGISETLIPVLFVM